MRSRSSKSNHFFPRPNNVPVQVSSKSTQWFRGCRQEATRTPMPKESAPKAICSPPLRFGDSVWSWVLYKSCLERGRCLNCVWNKIYRLEIHVQTPVPVSLTSIPHGSTLTTGLQHWHGLGELESKTHIKFYTFPF